jgi:sugar/nucleoside kinase (ribokinase family)
MNKVLVVGSVALDSVETPFGKTEDAIGGSGTFFAASASHLTKVNLVGVVGNDYPLERLEPLRERGVDLSGLVQADGESFRWRGRYRHDLNSAETIETRLGVFSQFRPRIPEEFRESPYVFLGNIDPRLQLDVLDQVEKPRLVACDTMNFWIESRRNEIIELLKRVDILLVNDGEARQLTEEFNLVRAARWVLNHGPTYVVSKKGEHGAYKLSPHAVFVAPAYPLEEVFAPTGAGDAFAGGYMGYLARTGRTDEAALRRAVISGSTLGSFAVERFSIDRLLEIHRVDNAKRLEEFRRLVAIEEDLEE